MVKKLHRVTVCFDIEAEHHSHARKLIKELVKRANQCCEDVSTAIDQPMVIDFRLQYPNDTPGG